MLTTIVNFFTRKRGGKKADVSDIFTYLYLIFGTIIMFGPVLWLVMSSFKTQAALVEFPPEFLPYAQDTATVTGVPGYADTPLKLYRVSLGGGDDRILARVHPPEEELALTTLESLSELADPQPAALVGEDGRQTLDVYRVTLEDGSVLLAAAVPDESGETQLVALADPTQPLVGVVREPEPLTLYFASMQDGRERILAEVETSSGDIEMVDPERPQSPVTTTIMRREQFPMYWVAADGDSGQVLGPAPLQALAVMIDPANQDEVLVVPEEDLDPLELFEVTLEDGSTKILAQVRRVGIEARMVDPNDLAQETNVPIAQRREIRSIQFAWGNYTEPLARFNFLTYLGNSIVVTVVATLITLVINSMAAFALSKYHFQGRNTIFAVIIATLMIPISVILVPVFLVITTIGWNNNLWGVIIPGAATPTGVFLLRQYMLTIPDELLDSARIDGATEWRIYWQIILPLAKPALAVLAIFSVMWRWNDFLWPLIVLTRSELFTLQVGLNSFQGELNVQWHYVLAMTVLTLLPITLVFAFLQRFITRGIATTGMK